MANTGHIVPPDLGNAFHEYDRVLRQNIALRRVCGCLPGGELRPPTGASLAALQEENQRLRAELERRGVEPPRVTEGAVQPTTLLDRARRHIPVDDPQVCPQCGDRRTGSVCRCGYSWARGLRRGGARAAAPRWDRPLAWAGGVVGVLVLVLWLLQPLLH